MTYVIATIKRLNDNAMVVADATDQNNIQFYEVDDKTELSEKGLYQVNAKIINDNMKFVQIISFLQNIGDDKYKNLYDEAVRKGFIGNSKEVPIKITKNVQKQLPEEIIEAEVIEEPVSSSSGYTSTIDNSMVVKKDEVIIAPTSGLPSMSDVDAYFQRYEYVKKTAISPSDYHTYMQGGKKRTFLKKSGFRKFIHAFGLKTEIIKIQNRLYPHTFANGKIVQGMEYEVMARAIAPNGQYTENVAICQQYEKGGNRTKHDVLTTATTRAINRAISDLVAFGEVSYEEL